MARRNPILAASLTLLAARSGMAQDYTESPPDLNDFKGTQLYYTWRPKAHVVPLYGRINDPCAHYTDPDSGTYHVSYLWNTDPQGITSCATNDMVTYDGCEHHVISPGGKNDPLAVFDGSVIPSGIGGKPTMMYSGVKSLPINWSMKYVNQSETQSLAVSSDGGKTFTKLDMDPVIIQPNSTTEPTGFRDPYAFHSYQLDSLLGGNDTYWYVAVSGGVKGSNQAEEGWEADAGPGQFLYRQKSPDDFESWDFLGIWFKESANTSFSDNKWAINWGFNMEVNNLQNIDQHGINNVTGEMFTTFGSEWATEWDGVVREKASMNGTYYRDMNWASGNISLNSESGEPKFTPIMASKLDWGLAAYAAHGQVLSANSQASKASGVDFDRWICECRSRCHNQAND